MRILIMQIKSFITFYNTIFEKDKYSLQVLTIIYRKINLYNSQ
jgi:hypothetical protein